MSTEPTAEMMNEVIAVFDGWERYEDKYGIWFKKEGLIKCMHLKLQELKYHTSWDWIVPVCRKIESMGYIVEVTFCLAGMCKIWNQKGVKGSGEHNEPIIAVLQAVYQFITWYNQQKQANEQ